MTADGIDALVNALRAVDGVGVTVIAPATNMSGTGARTSTGKLRALATTTQSGVAATAVQGYPADTVIYAVARGGMDDSSRSGRLRGERGAEPRSGHQRSGTVGAARQAAASWASRPLP